MQECPPDQPAQTDRGHPDCRFPRKMAMGGRLLLTFMWICLVITRTTYDRSFGRDDQEHNLDLLFAPSQLVVQAFRSPVVVCIWRGSSHLRPSTRAQLRRQAALPSCYWLLLLSGDIDTRVLVVANPCEVTNRESSVTGANFGHTPDAVE